MMVFNGPLETGVRSVALLTAAFPRALDLQRLVDFDYLVVHSGDADGPPSLHVPLPLRSGELLVRRHLVEGGLHLMMSRDLVERLADSKGLSYRATEASAGFLAALTSPYLGALQDTAQWVLTRFGEASDEELRGLTRRFFDYWSTQLVNRESGIGNSLR